MNEVQTLEQPGAYARHPLEIKRALPMALLRARESVMARFRPLLAAHGITEQQWRVMRLLAEQGPLDASAIASGACILASSLSRIIRTLERQGVITRARHAGDGRRVQLRLTEDGRRMIGEITPESLAIYAELEQTYGAERVAALLDMLNDLAEADASSARGA